MIRVLGILFFTLLVACDSDEEMEPKNLGSTGLPGYETVYAPYADALSARLTEEGIPNERYLSERGTHVVDWEASYNSKAIRAWCEVIPRPLPSFQAVAFHSAEEQEVFERGLNSGGVPYELAERRGETFIVWAREDHGRVQRIHTELFGSGLPNLRDEVHEERIRQFDPCERDD